MLFSIETYLHAWLKTGAQHGTGAPLAGRVTHRSHAWRITCRLADVIVTCVSGVHTDPNLHKNGESMLHIFWLTAREAKGGELPKWQLPPWSVQRVHKKAMATDISEAARQWPIIKALFDHRVLLRWDPKRPIPHLNVMKVSQPTGGFLIYTLLLNLTKAAAR